MNPQMQNYRQYPPAQARAPATRRPGPVPPNAHMTVQQQAQFQGGQHAQHRNIILEHQQAQRRARKPTDLNLPEGIEDLVIGDGVQQYKDLREAEKKLDYVMMRKRLDLHDMLNRGAKRQRTLRVWISNTAEHQPWQEGGMDDAPFDFSSGSDAVYRVSIFGKLLDDPDDDIMSDDDDLDEDEKAKLKTAVKPAPEKMSRFFKAMSVDFDRTKTNINDPGVQVEWKKPPKSDDIDQIRFTRRGDENQNITINLVRDEMPERYRLSNALSQALDMEEGDRAEVVMGLWEYVKAMGLQEDEEKRSIRCDDMLRQIFGRDQIYFPQIPDEIMQHLHPQSPIKLPYTIRVDEEYISNPVATVYDITVLVEDPLRAKINAYLTNPEHIQTLRTINRLNDEIAVLVQAAAHSKARHTFFREFSRDPVKFINKWTNSQRRDLEVILGEAGRGGGEDGMGVEFSRGGADGVWGSDVVREAARYVLARGAANKN